MIDRQTIRYRPRRDDDQPFLLALYGSTRVDELRVVPWSEAEKAEFIRMQFHAQSIYYDEQYNSEEFLIIEEEGRPIGRLYLDRQTAEEVHIIDIALLPEKRGQGLGRTLLQEILDEAAARKMGVTIHVEHFNPAMRLYERLGFRHVDTNGVYHLMRWDPPPSK